MKKYYLIKEATYFYDGHGEPEQGPINFYVGTYKELETVGYVGLEDAKLKPNIWYTDDYEIDTDDTEHYAEDGYHKSTTSFIMKEVNETEYLEYNGLLTKYNTLNTLKFV